MSGMTSNRGAPAAELPQPDVRPAAEGPGPQPELPPDAQADRPRTLAEAVMESTVGEDTRAPVPNTAAAPWSGLCQVKAQGAAVSHGTAFLISDRWAVTAAHVIVEAGHNPSVDVELVDGSVRDVAYLLHPQYLPQGSRAADIALLKLAAPAGAGFYKFKAFPFDDAFFAAFINSKAALVAGYPRAAAGVMYAGAGPVVGQSPSLLTHLVDTSRGQSGAPLFFRAPAATWVMGVHGHGDVTEVAHPGVPNTALRLNAAILAWINAAMQQL